MYTQTCFLIFLYCSFSIFSLSCIYMFKKKKRAERQREGVGVGGGGRGLVGKDTLIYDPQIHDASIMRLSFLQT